MSKPFDFNRSVSYVDNEVKRRWHSQARAKLKALAKALELDPGTYEIRSNYAGIAVSGEATLHGDHVYIQVSQLPFGDDSGILFRRCKGRKDYTGERNNFAPLSYLNNAEALAAKIERVLGPVYKLNANEVA